MPMRSMVASRPSGVDEPGAAAPFVLHTDSIVRSGSWVSSKNWLPDELLAQARRRLAEDLAPSGGRDLQVAVEVVDAAVDLGDDRAHGQ